MDVALCCLAATVSPPLSPVVQPEPGASSVIAPIHLDAAAAAALSLALGQRQRHKNRTPSFREHWEKQAEEQPGWDAPNATRGGCHRGGVYGAINWMSRIC